MILLSDFWLITLIILNIPLVFSSKYTKWTYTNKRYMLLVTSLSVGLVGIPLTIFGILRYDVLYWWYPFFYLGVGTFIGFGWYGCIIVPLMLNTQTLINSRGNTKV